jgi:AcrR family transcriptional regulator
MKESSRRTNREWSEATRAALADSAEQLIAERGFAEVSAQEIARAAGVTRGAIQYQFGDRRGLFAYVVDRVLYRIAARLATTTMGHAHGVHEVAAGTKLFAEAVAEPAVQRILLIDGPAVLGWPDWRERCSRVGLPLLTHGLEHWADTGIIARSQIAGLADVLLASTLHAALAAANGDVEPLKGLHLLIERTGRP